MLLSPVAQVCYSFLLLVGLVAGITAFVMASLARFFRRRLALGLVGVAGFTAFYFGTLMLTMPGIRLQTAYWWLFTIAIVGGAIGTVTARNVFHSALLLIMSLMGVAGFFILVKAEFLALVQVILYIGGIMVLFLFGIMVSQNIIGTEIEQNTPHAPWAAVLTGLLFVFLFFTGLFMSLPAQAARGEFLFANNVKSVGWSLMATFTLPFEVASVLLLMALMGAIVLVRKE
jgi:NADH-quinone oxidoreductase subunit J